MIHATIKLEQLQITILRQSHDLSETIIFLKENFHSYRPSVFSKFLRIGFTIYNPWYTLHAFLPNTKLEQFQFTVLKRLRDFNKTYNIYKVNFHCFCPNFSSNKKIAFLSNIRLEQLQITVLKESHDLSNSFFLKRKFSFPLSKCVFKGPRTYDIRCLNFVPNIKLEEL